MTNEEILAEASSLFRTLSEQKFYSNSFSDAKRIKELRASFWMRFLVKLKKALSFLFGKKFHENFVFTHETFIRNILKKRGYQELTEHSLQRTDAFGYKEDLKELRAFVYHPFGEYSDPDFALIVNGYIFFLELKATKTTKIKWNSLPNDQCVYLFSSGKTDSSTLFLGKDVVPQEVQKLMNRFKIEISLMTAKYRKLFVAIPDNHHGWTCSNGAMFVQQLGKRGKTDWIGNEKAEELLASTFEYLKEVIKCDSRS